MFTYKNNSPRWKKKQERNNVDNNNNSNYDGSNSINDNSFINENNCQTPKKQLSFITLPYKGQQGEKVINFFLILKLISSRQVYINLYQITQKQN